MDLSPFSFFFSLPPSFVLHSYTVLFPSNLSHTFTIHYIIIYTIFIGNSLFTYIHPSYAHASPHEAYGERQVGCWIDHDNIAFWNETCILDKEEHLATYPIFFPPFHCTCLCGLSVFVGIFRGADNTWIVEKVTLAQLDILVSFLPRKKNHLPLSVPKIIGVVHWCDFMRTEWT